MRVTIAHMNNHFHLETLDGGLTLLMVPMKHVQSVTTLVMVRTGSRDEPEKLSGISHFLEHMVFKGTEKYPTPLSISSTIDSFGGEFNAFTSKEFTGFYVKSAVEHFKTSVNVLSQMLTKPLLEEEAMEREKGVIVEEINMYEDLPTRKVSVLFDELLYGKNSLGRETIGTPEHVRSFTRADLLGYLRERYTREHFVVGVVGGMGSTEAERKSVQKRVLEGFSGLPSGKDTGWEEVKLDKVVNPKVLLFPKKTDQAHFVLGLPSFARGHKDRFVLSVLTTLLGGNMSSRLFTEVREKRGLAYYIKTDLDVYYETGSFTVHAGVEKSQLDEALRVVLEQFWQLRDGKLDDKEVKRAKENLKGRLILELEDSQEIADLYVRRYLLERNVMTPKELLDEVSAVSLEDVVRVAEELFDRKKLHLSVLGPYQEKDRQKYLKLLH